MVKDDRIVHLLGYACSLGGVSSGCGQGPISLQQSTALADLGQELELTGIHLQWDEVLKPHSAPMDLKAEELQRISQSLARATAELTVQQKFFMVTGGDHTSAIGTWSGVRYAKAKPVGLIWVDAHMDSHTEQTSQTGRLHGMPLATLLGHGDARFTQILSPQPKINPAQLCLIGVRSYEPGEAELLQRLQVRVYFMDEVKQRGLAAIFKEALEIVTRGTEGYGISFDIDSIDPKEAPGVDVPEPNGLSLAELRESLKIFADDPRLVGVELVEYNPEKDVQHKTEKAIIELMKALLVRH